MNRLILIENGFDLAHGLKTSYNDFIHSYILKCFDAAHNNNYNYEDHLIKISGKSNFLKDPEARFEWVENYLDGFNNHILSESLVGRISVKTKFHSIILNINRNFFQVC